MVGNNLRKIMAEKGIKAKDLAVKLGVSKTHLSYVLNNKRNPSLELLNNITEILGIPMAEIVKTDDLPEDLAEQKEQKKPKELLKFLEQSEVMFDGVPLTEEDKEKVRKALELAFWDAKQQNKRKK